VGESGGGCREKIVCCPSLDSVPEAVHASEGGGVWGEEVGPVCEYGGEEAVGDAVAEKGCNPSPWGGYAFDEGRNSLGQGLPMPEVVGGVEARGKPVP